MNGIEKITARIIADARAEADKIAADSASACAESSQASDKKAQDEYWRLIKEGTRRCEEQSERMARNAAMESKKGILAVKQEMVERAFAKAEELLGVMPESMYVPFLASQAASAASTGEEEVIFNERDRSSYAKAALKKANELLEAKGLPGHLTLSSETRDIKGGLILRQGDIEVNCSIEILVASQRGRMSGEVAKLLFD